MLEVIRLVFGVAILVIAAFTGLITFVLIFTPKSKTRLRLQEQYGPKNIWRRVLNGTFHRRFSDRKRLSVALGLTAEEVGGQIEISPQGRISRETLVEALGD